MIIARLTDMIRYEARLPGSSTATAFIHEIILEVLGDLTSIDYYQELLQTITQAIGVDGTSTIALPSDFQHIKDTRVKYLPSNDPDEAFFLLQSDEFDFVNSGQPNRYNIAGNVLQLFPYYGTLAGDSVMFEYYARITTLADTDEFPVPQLESAVKKAVVARVKATFGQDPSFQNQDSERSLARSKGNGTQD